MAKINKKPPNMSDSDWTKYWWKYERIYRFVEIIKNLDTPIESFVDSLVDEMGIFRLRQEPVAAIIRDVFGASKNGKTADVRNWDQLMPRVEKIVQYINDKGNAFSKVVANESIAHRYADYLMQTGDIKYEEKMLFHYLLSHKLAKKKGYLKNIDSTLYWIAVAYERASDVASLSEFKDRFLQESKKYYCMVASRKGKRFKRGPAFGNKIKVASSKCKSL